MIFIYIEHFYSLLFYTHSIQIQSIPKTIAIAIDPYALLKKKPSQSNKMVNDNNE